MNHDRHRHVKLKCKCENNGAKSINILSFDGGGMRGLFSLHMLKKICDQTLGDSFSSNTRKFITKFDIICGTSTGAIIALALATGYSINRIIDLYTEMIELIFYQSKLLYPVRLARYAKTGNYYDQSTLTYLFKKYFREKTLKETSDGLLAKVIITTTNATNSDWVPYLFTSYNTADQDIFIHDILTAATAAPSYFAPVHLQIGNNKLVLVDGGCCVNNPTELAIFEAQNLYPCSSIGVILSLGTGTINPSVSSFNLIGLAHEFVHIATNSQEIHHRILEWLQLLDNEYKIFYFRFSPPNLGSIPLDTSDKDTINKGIIGAISYMEQPGQQNHIPVIYNLL